jgi:hypothetical protein
MAHCIGADIAPFGPLDRGVMIPGKMAEGFIIERARMEKKDEDN